MKTVLLLLAASLAASVSHATDEQVIELGDGTTVTIKNGSVSVCSSSNNGGSASSSVSSQTVNGNTTATVTTKRDAQSVTRTITIGPDGKAVVSEIPGGTAVAPVADAVAGGTGGWLGIHSKAVPEALRAQLDIPEGEGVLVEFVAAGGPAEKAGVLANDLLLTLDGNGLKGVQAFRELLSKARPGQPASLGLLRKGKALTVNATLGARPSDPAASVAGGSGTRPGQGGGASSSSTTSAVILGGDGKFVQGKSGRSIIVTGDGKTRIIEDASGADPFESVLNDPNIPSEMKDQIRKAQAEFKRAREEAEKRLQEHSKTPPGDKTDKAPETPETKKE